LNKWKKTAKNISPNIWIEAIPYAETRNYVKQVISFELIYSQLLKQRKLGSINLTEIAKAETKPHTLKQKENEVKILADCIINDIGPYHRIHYKLEERTFSNHTELCY